MIAGHDFFVLSDPSDGLPTSTMHLFRCLMKTNRVFWLNTINRMPRLQRTDVTKLATTVQRWFRVDSDTGSRVVNAGVFFDGEPNAVSPVMIPWFVPPVRAFNRLMISSALRRVTRRHGVRQPIAVATFPSAVDVLRSINCALKLYYCVDDWQNLPGYHSSQLRIMENQLLAAVDGLVVTSTKLAEKRRPGCPTLYLPHGVDFDHFNRQAADAGVEKMIASIRRPIVGFFGVIGEWVNVNLIRILADAFPAVSFVLIGAVAEKEVSLDAVQQCSNVHFLGRVDYAVLPRWASHFDVGLIPFVLNELTRAVNPVKLMEYFALGLPVLATRLPELERIGGPMELASSADEFREGLCRILGQGLGRRQDAIELARSATWETRAEKFSEFVENLLGGSGHRPG